MIIGSQRPLAALTGPTDNVRMTAELRAAMPRYREESPETGVDDGFLAASIIGGDPAALRQMLARYDRLVRYTVFHVSQQRCHDDPQWLDSVASATWTGFVQSLNRAPDQLPASMPAYLTRIARNQAVSALRRKGLEAESLDAQDDMAGKIGAEAADPLEMLSQLEDMESLQKCLAAVAAEDRPLLGQLEAITSRRWKMASESLGVAESTLRSRWRRLLDRLRLCMTAKSEKSLAPEAEGGD